MPDDFQDGLQDVMQLVHSYPVPPEGATFDASTAPRGHLSSFGLPEQPDASAEPDFHAFWQLLLGGSTTIITPKFSTVSELVDDHARARSPQRGGRDRLMVERAAVILAAGHSRSSRNWSGAYLTPVPRPNRFVQVVGRWVVPSPAVPDLPPSGVDKLNAVFRSSTWIGIGGKHSYISLPQIGTHQYLVVENGTPTPKFEAWWQWWIKDRPGHNVAVPITNFDVQPGDGILASMTVEAPLPGDVRFILMNQRTGVLVAFKVQAPANILPVGATAEWVHERPSENRMLFPLPHCSDVVFSNCLAWNAPGFGAAEVLQTFDSKPHLVRMSEMFEGPHRSAFVSVPQRDGPSGMRIVYKEAGSAGV